jgi:peroxiredoxin
VSKDSPSKNQAWAEEEGFDFELWSDDDGTLGVTYGALRHADDPFETRYTMLLDDDGDLLLEYTDNVVVGTHPGQVLDDCEIIFGG